MSVHQQHWVVPGKEGPIHINITPLSLPLTPPISPFATGTGEQDPYVELLLCHLPLTESLSIARVVLMERKQSGNYLGFRRRVRTHKSWIHDDRVELIENIIVSQYQWTDRASGRTNHLAPRLTPSPWKIISFRACRSFRKYDRFDHRQRVASVILTKLNYPLTSSKFPPSNWLSVIKITFSGTNKRPLWWITFSPRPTM